MQITDKIGQKVRMKTGAVGTIVEVGSHIRVDFDGTVKEFQLDAFDKGFLAFLDESLQSDVDAANEAARVAAEKAEAERQERERAALEERKKRWAEEAAKKAQREAAKRKGVAKANQGRQSGKPHPYIDARRTAGKRCIFMVCQNANYDLESRGGYLWAPMKQPGKTDHSSHEELDHVKAGDIVFHHFKSTIFAVSVAKGDRVIQAPADGSHAVGRYVDLSYHFLANPASTDALRALKASSSVKYGPFNIYGNNKEGFYLSELPEELALAFIDAAIAANPGDADLIEIRKYI